MIQAGPVASDIICESATATNASLVTVPAGRWATIDISLTVTAALAGTASASVTWTPSGTGTGPATNKTIARCTATGLATAGADNSSYITALLYGGDTGASGTIGYTAPSSGSGTCAINGFLL